MKQRQGHLKPLPNIISLHLISKLQKSNSMKCMSVGAKNITRQSQKVTLKDAKPHIYYASQ